MATAGLALAVALAGAAACTPRAGGTAEIDVRHSRFAPAAVTVPAGVPVTIRLRNEDPIDHEWIVGDEEIHAAHRSGTEPVHAARPTEVSLPALSTRTTTVTFAEPGRIAFVCHLPGHEAYGMTGVVTVTP